MHTQPIPRWQKGKRGSVKLPLHANPLLAELGCTENFVTRFWQNVFVLPYDRGCWIWLGLRNAKQYGHVPKGPQRGSFVKAHRASWLINKGRIPDGLCVLHKCDNAWCVNPDHLWLGTVLENNADMLQKGRGAKPPAFYGDEWRKRHINQILPANRNHLPASA